MDGAKTAVGKHIAEEQTSSSSTSVRPSAPSPAASRGQGNVTKLVSAENMQRSSDLALKIAGPSSSTMEGIGG